MLQTFSYHVSAQKTSILRVLLFKWFPILLVFKFRWGDRINFQNVQSTAILFSLYNLFSNKMNLPFGYNVRIFLCLTCFSMNLGGCFVHFGICWFLKFYAWMLKGVWEELVFLMSLIKMSICEATKHKTIETFL